MVSGGMRKEKSYDPKKRHEYYMKHRKLKGKRKGKAQPSAKKQTKGTKKSGTSGLGSSVVKGSGGSGTKTAMTPDQMMDVLNEQKAKMTNRLLKLRSRIQQMSPSERKEKREELLNEIKQIKNSIQVTNDLMRKVSEGSTK